MNTLPQAPAAEHRQVPSPVPGRTARRFKGTHVRLSPHTAGHRGLKAGGRSPVGGYGRESRVCFAADCFWSADMFHVKPGGLEMLGRDRIR